MSAGGVRDEVLRDELIEWLRARCEPAAIDWLGSARNVLFAYSASARHFSHEPLDLTAEERAQAETARPGWQPAQWTRCEAARAWLLLSPGADEKYDQLCASAEVHELTAFYKALPILPNPESLCARASEGLRTNITDVFCAVAHHNPFPSEQFDEVAWNTMVLKALFIGVELAPIHGLDDRANTALMRMLCNYAHERWAAGRTVSSELWRCVGPFADAAATEDLQRVIADGSEEERTAAEVALAQKT